MTEKTSNWPNVLAALEEGERRTARSLRIWQLAMVLITIWACILTVASFEWALTWLRVAWDTDRWGAFWEEASKSLWATGLVLQSTRLRDQQRTIAENTRRLRDAAIYGDERKAPIARENGQITQDSNALFGGVSYGPLKRPNDNRSVLPVLFTCIAVFIALVLGVVLLTNAGSRPSEGDMRAEQIVWGIVLFLLLLSIWLVVVFRRMQRGIVVTANDAGITWKQVGWRTQNRYITWHDARAFFVVTRRKSITGERETTWVLMGSTGALAWIAPTEAAPDTDTSPAQFAALVAARARLPLRDLSALANEVTGVTPKPHGNVPPAESGIETSAPMQDTAIAPQTQPDYAQARPSHGLGWGTVRLMLVIAVLLFSSTGWGLQQYRPHYFADLLAQIHAGKPLYHNDLTYSKGGWRVAPPTSKGGGLVFKGGAYNFTRTMDYTAYSWATLEGDDAAIDVTARQIGTADTGGVGLVLRANADGSNMVTFYVDATGIWWLWHYRFLGGNDRSNWTLLDLRHSSAIYTGAGAENQLLVLMRGNQYVCYVNGRLVEVYRDEHHELPSAGRMGVYLNDGSTEGVFSNFAVYPAPPPSFWSEL